MPNENREVVLYDHFAGDDSSLKFIIKFRNKKVFTTSFYVIFKASRAESLPSSDYFCVAFVAALAYFVVFAGFAHIRLVRVCQHFL